MAPASQRGPLGGLGFITVYQSRIVWFTAAADAVNATATLEMASVR